LLICLFLFIPIELIYFEFHKCRDENGDCKRHHASKLSREVSVQGLDCCLSPPLLNYILAIHPNIIYIIIVRAATWQGIQITELQNPIKAVQEVLIQI